MYVTIRNSPRSRWPLALWLLTLSTFGGPAPAREQPRAPQPDVLVVKPGSKHELSLGLDAYSTVLSPEAREWVESFEPGRDVEVLVRVDGEPVLVRQANRFVCTFHPELTADRRVHSLLLEAAR